MCVPVPLMFIQHVMSNLSSCSLEDSALLILNGFHIPVAGVGCLVSISWGCWSMGVVLLSWVPKPCPEIRKDNKRRKKRDECTVPLPIWATSWGLLEWHSWASPFLAQREYSCVHIQVCQTCTSELRLGDWCAGGLASHLQGRLRVVGFFLGPGRPPWMIA